MANKLRRMEIEPAENGGHTVTHHFKEVMKANSKTHSGIGGGFIEPEKHVFGEGEGHEMLAHIANHLKIEEPKEAPDDEPDGFEE